MKTAYKFRMYPNRQQVAQLELTLDTCRYLYNLALADRKNVYETEGIGQSKGDVVHGISPGLGLMGETNCQG